MSDRFQPKYSPVQDIVLYLTEDCNLRCTYCFVDKKARRMNLETAQKSVDFFYDRRVSGVAHNLSFSFFGGEPFIELDLMEAVIRMARDGAPNAYKRPTFSATTNGTVASPHAERVIRDARMRLLVSMDGGHGATGHRPFVSGRSSYDLVARNLPKLAEWAFECVVRMTFHPGALDLVGNIRHALALGAPSVALCPVLEVSWDGHEDALEAAYQDLADWYIQEARNGRMLPLEITHSMLQRWHRGTLGGSRPERACSVGSSLLSIDPDGNVMPCHRFLYRKQDWLGTVDDPALSTKRTPYLHLASRELLGCEGCVAESVCGGGCRLVALQAGYDIETGMHPAHCLTTRAHTRAVQRIYDTLMAEDSPVLRQALRSPRPLNAALTELVTK